MAKNLTNNQLLIREYVKQEFPSTTYAEEAAFFEFFAASQALKEYDLSDEEIEKGLIGGGDDGGCDALYMFFNETLVNEDIIETVIAPKEAKLEVVILQTKNELSFNEGTIEKWKTTSNNLLQLDNELSDFDARYRSEVLAFFQMFKDLRKKLLRTRLSLEFKYYYISLASDLHFKVKAQAEELKQIVQTLFPESTTKVEFINADMLMSCMNTEAENTFNLTLSERPIEKGSNKDFIALVALKDYYRFITDENGLLRRHIFEANVRDYQGNNSVNNEIKETLSSEVVEDFWWLNNGVTILAAKASFATGKELLIINPEIVNGLQTSTEIHKHFQRKPETLEIETRNILVRIIAPESDSSRDKIILATNSQTSIPSSTLRATDPIHRQIEMYFKNRGLHYDRRKNFYKNQGKKTHEIVGVTFLGQCLMALYLQKPNFARARPSTLLNNDEHYRAMFTPNGDLEVFYRTAMLGKSVEQFIKKSQDYTSAAKNDILFYVLYFVVGTHLGKSKITQNDIKVLGDISVFDALKIDCASKSVFNEY